MVMSSKTGLTGYLLENHAKVSNEHADKIYHVAWILIYTLL